MRQAFDHFAAIWVARNDSRFATFGNSQRLRPKKQAEIALSFHATMTNDTFFVQQRLYLRIEVNFITAEAVRKGIKRPQNDDANKNILDGKDMFHDAVGLISFSLFESINNIVNIGVLCNDSVVLLLFFYDGAEIDPFFSQ